MQIPNTVYQLSRFFTIISIVLELLAVIILAISVFVRDYSTKTSVARDFFKAGVRVRSAVLCLLVFLFLIARRGMRIGEMSILSAVSSVFELFASLSVYVFVSSIVLSIVAAIKKASFADMKDLLKRIEISSMWSMLLGFLLAYFLYIP